MKGEISSRISSAKTKKPSSLRGRPLSVERVVHPFYSIRFADGLRPGDTPRDRKNAPYARLRLRCTRDIVAGLAERSEPRSGRKSPREASHAEKEQKPACRFRDGIPASSRVCRIDCLERARVIVLIAPLFILYAVFRKSFQYDTIF